MSEVKVRKSVWRKNYTMELSETYKVLISLISGATAGAVAKSTIAPLDRCKIFFQINNQKYTTKAAIMYLSEVYRTQGLLALWRGNSATMARILPYASIQFSSHEQWKKLLGIGNGQATENLDYLKEKRFLAGSLAGVTSQSLTYPLDVARARMAVTHNADFASLQKVFRKTWKLEGISGFYRGYIPTILGVIPYAGASFFTYETLKAWYSNKTNGKMPRTLERLGFGAVSGLCGQTVSYPLDIVRRRMQTSIITNSSYTTVWGSLLKIYKEEGIKGGYFKGLSMNWIKGPIAVGISFATYDLVKDSLMALIRSR